jgi:DNA-binding NarL/FixJ family response regulator
MPIKLLIADDHRLILQAITRALASAEDISIVGEARAGSQVLPLISQTKPDVVLLDIRMPEIDGLGCIERAQKEYADVRFIVLSAFTDRQHVDDAFARGAAGYVSKSVDPRELADAIRRVVAGETLELGLTADADAEDDGLTERELEMLRAVARGLSNRAMSTEFWITEQTVKFHLTNIYRKLGVSNRTEAARYAYSRGIVDAYSRTGDGTQPPRDGLLKV